MAVIELNCAVLGNPQTPTDPGQARRVLHRPRVAGAGVKRFFLAGVRSLNGAKDILSGAGARVNQLSRFELFENGTVELDPFALVVRGERTAHVGTFVPLEPEPFQVSEHGLHKLRPDAAAVEIVIAQNEGAASDPFALLSYPKGTRVAEMQVAGGRRSQATAINLGKRFHARGSGGSTRWRAELDVDPRDVTHVMRAPKFTGGQFHVRERFVRVFQRFLIQPEIKM